MKKVDGLWLPGPPGVDRPVLANTLECWWGSTVVIFKLVCKLIQLDLEVLLVCAITIFNIKRFLSDFVFLNVNIFCYIFFRELFNGIYLQNTWLATWIQRGLFAHFSHPFCCKRIMYKQMKRLLQYNAFNNMCFNF